MGSEEGRLPEQLQSEAHAGGHGTKAVVVALLANLGIAVAKFVDATSTPPFLYELTPAEARKVLDDVQAEPIDKPSVDDRWITVPAEVGEVSVRIVRPPDATGTLPVILYMHGGGWVLGNAQTHDRLVRELAVGTGAAVVFVEYDRSPEAHYPVALEQGYATAQWIARLRPSIRARTR